MTTVNISLQKPGLTGPVGATGKLLWQPTSRHLAGDDIILPDDFEVTLAAGAATVNIVPSGDTWAWRVTEVIDGLAKFTRFVIVPASGTVAYADLVDVNPASLDPAAVPAPAWVEMANSTISSGEVSDSGKLLLTRTDGSIIDAGYVSGSIADDNTVSSLVSEDTQTRAALNATILDGVKAETFSKWAPDTDYETGDRAWSPSGLLATRRTPGTSGAQFDGTNWIIGLVAGSNVPTVKPMGDGRPGVWEMTHDDTTGYLYHLLAGANFGVGGVAALIAMGVDQGQGSGLLVVNKAAGSNGITVSQRSTVTNWAAFIGTQESTSVNAPLMNLSSNVSGAANLLELLSFNGAGAVAPTASQKAFYFGDPNGQAGAMYSADGRLEWRRPVRIMDRGANANFVEVTENESVAYGATNAYNTRHHKKGMTWYAPSGGGTLWSYKMEAGGSHLRLFTGAAGAFGADPATTIFDVQHGKFALFGATPVVQAAAIASPTADVASLKTAVDAIRAALTGIGITA